MKRDEELAREILEERLLTIPEGALTVAADRALDQAAEACAAGRREECLNCLEVALSGMTGAGTWGGYEWQLAIRQLADCIRLSQMI